MSLPIDIAHSEAHGRGAFTVTRDGARLAVMEYRRDAPDRVTIVHTEVDDALRGLGIARQLLDATVAWARATGTRLGATCSYAAAQLAKDPSSRDVFAP
ncbi:MAG: GNAT family N-acetyltransferase [Deltaproteobacteria bacterium HGW-Deltaproteobacteria-14]|jgi:hypothetical protein|nr:MAG: GNAT family N-acetyltransferase [Deltaproteobacteria bacterium HGW-Deltaproteobacteria-14]